MIIGRVLVVGAMPGSIGRAVAHSAELEGYEAVTAGVSGHERDVLDLVGESLGSLAAKLALLQPQHIVVTAGINDPLEDKDPASWYLGHFSVNVTGPMRLLTAWRQVVEPGNNNHYAVISSNSARVPRTGSAAYCASKAALSMALRCEAREGAVKGGPVVYGYEPGLVARTPMTVETEARFGSGVPLTRMRPPMLATGLPAKSLGYLVASNLRLGWEMNGLLVPLDADEA